MPKTQHTEGEVVAPIRRTRRTRTRMTTEALKQMFQDIEEMAQSGKSPNEIAHVLDKSPTEFGTFLKNHGYTLTPVKWELGISKTLPYIPQSFKANDENAYGKVQEDDIPQIMRDRELTHA